ncbi:ribose transport system substrate-binding protein [Lentzea xinjiangensis]|uniref:Ribose transport system substrate-binding protein n=1 Tax=Lentzea xinjiangensis TaxID=402600 RepID=A0A1H9PQG4_9PSEU|nr:ribose transport system substrate-binding protein [Lentzea xinjiangensis]
MFATDLNTGGGAATGLRNAGRTDAVNLVGFDASPKQVQGVEQALAAIEGRETERDIETDLITITKDDAQAGSKYSYKQSCAPAHQGRPSPEGRPWCVA